MSGFGERFRRAGYQMPKPLIEVDGKPIIEHVVNMFPGEEDFLFICNEDHLDETSYKMREVLNRICPTGSIVGIPSHKLGPVHAIQCVRDMVGDQEPVIVNYCDLPASGTESFQGLFKDPNVMVPYPPIKASILTHWEQQTTHI